MQFEELWKQIQDSMSIDENLSALSLFVFLPLAGLFGLYIKIMYTYFCRSPSDSESISRVFPLLALVTAGVIVVVKSSLALSLGLVGALSIVRFRAAIKEPEELVYLFLCIAVGLAFGAEQPLLACSVVGVATVFIVGMSLASRGKRRQRLLLTISGDSDRYFAEGENSVFTTIDAIAGHHTIQRFDIENGRAQLRLVLGDMDARKTTEIITTLRTRLPGCDLSYVNLNSNL